jgi:DNA helicase HerA-like ATPase
MRTDRSGRGYVNILAADKLMNNPRLYATFLLWLLSELFEQLPEVGDPDKPKLVFFFDEAHLLFNEAPKALLQKVEQVVRLIRSKGVGVYFVTQNPIDVPETVLSQLGNRVQHALRAYTPSEQKGVKAAAQAFRPNPKINTERVITELGKGEALVSFLEGNGVPEMVQQTLIRPPSGRIGPVTDSERRSIVSASPIKGKYDTTIDRDSAYEMLQKKAATATAEAQGENGGGIGSTIGGMLGGIFGRGGSRRMSTGEVVVKQVARSVASQVGTQVGRALVRGLLGSLKR